MIRMIRRTQRDSSMMSIGLLGKIIGRTATLSTIIGRAASTGRMRIMTGMMTAMTGFGTRESFDNNDFRFLI